LEFDREGLTKLKKAVKAIHNSGNSESDKIYIIFKRIIFGMRLSSAHVDNEMFMVRALERLGGKVIEQDEPDIGAAFLKFSVVTKDLYGI